MKKVSGIYVDNQGFRHTVFYNRFGKDYTKLIHNSKGEFCSSCNYSKEEVLNEVQGMRKSFLYLGKLFTPIGNTGLDFFEMSKNLGMEFIRKGYSHKSFYAEARKNGCKIVDLYKCEGKTVIPAGALFEYLG